MSSGFSENDELIKYIDDVKSSILFVLDIFLEKILSIIDKVGLKKVVVSNLTESMGMINKIGARASKGIKHKKIPQDSRLINWKEFINKFAEVHDICIETTKTAVITYTGGTTGGSKGVELSNYSIISMAQQYIWCKTALSRGQTWLQVIPLYVAFGVCASLQLPLMAGQTIIIRVPLSESLAEMCEKIKPNHIVFGPVQWEELADENRNINLSFLVEPTSGGDRLPLPVEEKINRYLLKQGSIYPLMNGYGMSEVGAAVAVGFKLAHRVGSVGIPLCKNTIAAFNVETGEECQYGQEGELCIHTPSMMNGYVNAPEETLNVIREHSDKLKWVHTGDIGYIDKDGFVFVSGRIKRYFIYIENSEQKKIFSLDIEKVLLKHPRVKNCAVVPRNDEKHGQVGIAYIQLRSTSDNLSEVEKELRIKCKNELDMRARPRAYRFVDEFPTTRLGKVDYRELEHMESSRSTI